MEPAPKGMQWVQDPGGQWHLVPTGPSTPRRFLGEASKAIAGVILGILVLVLLWYLLTPKTVVVRPSTTTLSDCGQGRGAVC